MQEKRTRVKKEEKEEKWRREAKGGLRGKDKQENTHINTISSTRKPREILIVHISLQKRGGKREKEIKK